MPITPYYTITVTNPGTDDEETVYTPNTNLPTPAEIRSTWCFGLPLNSEDGSVMGDDLIYTFIQAAIDKVERYLGIYLKPTVIACNPMERGLSEGVDYEKEEPPYDYDAKSWMNYGYLQLRERRVREITGFKLVLPNGQIIMDFMTRREWLKVYAEAGQVQIVPYAGDPTMFALLGGSVSGYPFVTGTINANLPQMLYVDYTAGYPLWQIPANIRNVIAKIAASDTLGIAADANSAGIASLSTSIDGLSESYATTDSATSGTYSSHISQYAKDIKDFFSPKGEGARSTERGITFTIL
jgi:hypothetical protein